MIFKQFYLACLSHASYMIGDESTKTAVVVDPQRDIEQYLAFAKEYGLEIKHVFLTHFHADFVAGHIELKSATGATIYLGARAQAEYDFTPVANGFSLELGGVKLEVLETPGHTPESISILLYENTQKAPYAVLTGDALFVGDVGRPDLLASFGVTAEELGIMLYDSLHNKLLKLPDDTLVYPAHGAGSMCGKHLGKELHTTIGQQRLTNYALQPMSMTDFVNMVSAGQPPAPPYFAYDAAINRKQRSTLGEVAKNSRNKMTLERVLRLANGGVQILDVRSADDYVASHMPGSIHIGLEGKFATWAGTMLDKEKPVIVVASPGQLDEAITRLGRIGFDLVLGVLDAGELEHNAELSESAVRIKPAQLETLLAASAPPVVVDLRTATERETAGFISGSLNIPLEELQSRWTEIPREKGVVVQCASGYRSSIGQSLLLNAGIKNVVDLAGGYTAWAQAKSQAAGAC